MPFIKAKNGNVVEFEDDNLGKRALADGHEVYTSDPRAKGSKAEKWEPADDAGTDSE